MDERPPMAARLPAAVSDAHRAETARSGAEREVEAQPEGAAVEPGRLFGPFRVLGTLGSGGMGVVYEAEHVESAARVALKAVRAPRAWMLGSIRREIQALATLDHPGIVRIVAEGVSDGMPWYAMPHLPGTTLDRGPLLATGGAASRPGAPGASGSGLRAALTLVARLCEPLRYLHGEGFVHRDLKPANVLVGAEGWPVLIDFGLVTRIGGEASRDAAEISSLGSGTLGYMAPEQLRGEPVDARADLYALGCILFELVTGLRPYRATDPAALAGQHASAPLPMPSELADGIPEGIDALVAQLLAKSPRDRLGYADDVAEALRRLGADDEAVRGAPPRTYLYRPLLAGRGLEIGRLSETLAACLRRQPALLVLSGESGAGKTRLLAELARLALDQRADVVLGGCAPERRTPLDGFGPLLRWLADRCRERGDGETARLLGPHRGVLAEHAACLAELPWLAALPAPEALPPAAARQRLFAALADAVAGLASDAPLVLGIDDVQWADDLTFGALEHLQRVLALSPAAVLVVLACRREEPRAEIERLLEAGAVALDVSRLDERAVGAMARDMLALRAVPDSLARSIFEASEGNPLFVAEYLRAAVDGGLFVRDRAAGSWHVAAAEGGAAGGRDALVPLPRSLQSLIARHVDDLDPAARGLLEAAAVVGRHLRADVLAAAADVRPEEAARPLVELFRRHMLERTDDGATFAHDKVRELVYARIEPGRRAAMHRRAAEALEAVEDAAGTSVAADLACHWDAAGEPARALPFYLAGGRAALREHAARPAERLLSRYLELVPVPTSESVEVRTTLGREVHQLAGRMAAAELELRRAIEEAGTLGDRLLAGKAMVCLSPIVRKSGRPAEAQGLVDDARRVAAELTDAALEASALGEASQLHLARGELDEAQAALEGVARLGRELGDRRVEGLALGNLASLMDARDRFPEALARAGEALAIHREVGNRRSEAIVLGNRAATFMRMHRHEEAGLDFERALEICREVGNLEHEPTLLGNLALLRKEQGRSAEALEGFDRVISLMRVMGHAGQAAPSLANRAAALSSLGRLDEALAGYEEALAIARRSRNRRLEAMTLANAAMAHGAQGRPEEALALLATAEAMHREAGERHALGVALCNHGELLEPCGRAREAGAASDEALTIARELGDRRLEARALGNLAAWHAAQGEAERACELYDAAFVLERESGDRVNEALHRRRKALLLLAVRGAHGDTVLAGDLLRRSEALLRDLGDDIELAGVRCVRAHMELGQDALPLADRLEAAASVLAEARKVAARAGAGPCSPLGRDVESLAQAVAELRQRRPPIRGV